MVFPQDSASPRQVLAEVRSRASVLSVTGESLGTLAAMHSDHEARNMTLEKAISLNDIHRVYDVYIYIYSIYIYIIRCICIYNIYIYIYI